LPHRIHATNPGRQSMTVCVCPVSTGFVHIEDEPGSINQSPTRLITHQQQMQASQI
jgi:hypothetical protein